MIAYGDAAFYRSMVGQPLNQPIVGIASDKITDGYWLVAYDGGLLAFHAGSWCGSPGGQGHEGIVAIRHGPECPQPRLLVGLLGRRHLDLSNSCNTPYYGSMQGTPLNAPIVGIAQM